MRTDKRALYLFALISFGACVSCARADLKESQVLVVYDSRIPDSKAVAEYYAGSSKVPGGTGGLPGARPGVRVVDLFTLSGGGVFPVATDITYANFVAKLRNPLRLHLSTNSLSRTIRCLVLTKGLPHRILDFDVPGAGDQPGQAAAEMNAGDVTYSSVDSELTLLNQTLETGENGGLGDSKSDGGILNPFARTTQPISGYGTMNIQSGKNYLAVGGFGGILWRTLTVGASALTAGDIYLVCRLDGPTLPQVFASIDRAQNITLDLETATIILDESGSDGLQFTSDADSEIDNDGPVSFTNGGDDYEQTRDLLTGDGRFAAANIRYNAAAGASQFFVGPLVNYGGGIVVNNPIMLLATYGNNHNGSPGTAGTTYPTSYIYAPGAIFNTIESYNGRAFGGLGVGPTPQAQLSDFIASGGTFGIGNVWEPFSFTVADNLQITRNFLLGNMSWAEAAYTAIPLLSWQQVVIGDPLARVRRVKEDVNGDGANTIEDAYAWGPAPVKPDLNRSGVADGADLFLLVRSLRAGENGNMRPDGR